MFLTLKKAHTPRVPDLKKAQTPRISDLKKKRIRRVFLTLKKRIRRVFLTLKKAHTPRVPDLNANLLLVVQPVEVEVKGALMSAEVGKVLVGLVAPAALVRLDPLVPVLVVQHLLLVHETL